MQLNYKFNHKNVIYTYDIGGKQQYSCISPMEKHNMSNLN